MSIRPSGSLLQSTDPLLLSSELQQLSSVGVAVGGETRGRGEEDDDDEEGAGKLPRATLQQKIRVLDWHNASEKKHQLNTFQHFAELGEFAITRSTLNRWVMTEDKLREEAKNCKLGNAKSYKTKPKYKHPEVNRCLELFYEQALREGTKYTEKSLISKWSEFYLLYYNLSREETGSLNMKSSGWLFYFKKRSEIRRNVIQSYLNQAKETKISTLSQEKLRLQRLLQGYLNHQIYQFDEIAVRTELSIFESNHYGQSKSNSINNSINSNINGDDLLDGLSFDNPTKRVIVGVLANADGSSNFPPLILTDQMTSLGQSLIPNLYYQRNGILSPEVFHAYLKKLHSTLHEPIVILCDTYQAHFVPTNELPKIKIIYLSDSLKKLRYQPLSYGILRLFKVMIKDCILQHCLKRIMLGYNNAKDFQFTKLDLISFVSESWGKLIQDPMLFVQCFRNSGILPKRTQTEDGEEVVNDEENDQTFEEEDRRMMIIKDNTRESQLIGLLKLFNDKNYIRFNFTIDSFLFPQDERVRNLHMSDRDILLLVKREFSEFSTDLSNHGVSKSVKFIEDPTESREIASLLFRRIKPFFDKNLNTETALQFSKFLNVFVKESNQNFLDTFMNDNNVKEKIERKRRRDENISANNRYSEFEKHYAIYNLDSEMVQSQANNHQRMVQQSQFAYPFNNSHQQFPDNLGGPVNKRQQVMSQSNERFIQPVIPYPDFSLPIGRSISTSTNPSNNEHLQLPLDLQSDPPPPSTSFFNRGNLLPGNDHSSNSRRM